MSKTLRQAEISLAELDPVMAKLIKTHGPSQLKLRCPDPFNVLVRSIISQQLSVKAAATILKRVEEVAQCEKILEAHQLINLDQAMLRSCGLSMRKAEYVLEITHRVQSGTLDFKKLRGRDDSEVIDALTEIKGVGQWTAEMFLIFGLGRLDVLSAVDIGLQRGAMYAYELKAKPTPEQFFDLAERWRPYRSIASWYLWREADKS